MYCSRLIHFARLNTNGTVTRCGHMVQPELFKSFDDLEHSEWNKNIKHLMDNDIWPKECKRCQDAEHLSQQSIREASNDAHKILKLIKHDYLTIGGVLDNVCNSACQTCDSKHSTKIGSLVESNYIKINNSTVFWDLPTDRIVKLDINGGEPCASPNYQRLLENLPPNVKFLRVNTNGSRVLPNLDKILSKGIKVTVTVSLDGLGSIHDYVRWPIKWETVEKNLMVYKDANLYELNTWTTVSALNVAHLPDIIEYTKKHNLNHSWALLEEPVELNVRYKNWLTKNNIPEFLKDKVAVDVDNTERVNNFISKQDSLRGISIKDYYK